MAEKAKSRGASAKSRRDKSRSPVRAQLQHPRNLSPKSPGRTPPRGSPGEHGGGSPPWHSQEPLDAEPILNELLDRVMTECEQRALARKRVPFAVLRVRDAIIFVTEWRFLVRDEGDPDPGDDPDPGGDTDPERVGIWTEDEEPQTCPWDSWTQGAASILDVSLPSEQVPFEDFSEEGTAEAGGFPVCSGEVPDAVPVLRVPLPSKQVPRAKPPCQDSSAAARAPPAKVPGPKPPCQVSSAAARAPPVKVPGPKPPCHDSSAAVRAPAVKIPGPEPPIAPRPPGKDPRLARPPRPRPVPLGPPRPPAPLPAEPSKPPGQRPSMSRGASAEAAGQVPPPLLPSRSSRESIQPRRPSRGPGVPISGVPRLGTRRGAPRWVLPEVKVLDMTAEPERALFPRGGRGSELRTSRLWRLIMRSVQVLPAIARPPKREPQLCVPWLAAARLAPGVTVRWGGSERRGPGAAGHDRQEDGEQKEDEALRKAVRELMPILPNPVCRLSEYED